MEGQNILGIACNTRNLGLAVFIHHTLVYYSAKLYKQLWSPKKAHIFLSSLVSCIRDHDINVMVLSRPNVRVQSKEQETLYQLIKRVAYEKKVRIEEIATENIRLLCQETGKKNKRTQMEVLCGIYEELRPYFIKEIRNKSKYYEKMFDAIGVGTLYLYQ